MKLTIITKKLPASRQSCNPHPGESKLMTREQRHCKVCGKIYYYDCQPWDNAAINKPARSGGCR